jgi:hypothetical protein
MNKKTINEFTNSPQHEVKLQQLIKILNKSIAHSKLRSVKIKQMIERQK